MEEYTQLTLEDWLSMKEKLRLELQGVKQSFVRIGYTLRKISDAKMYEAEGYKSVAEFAKAEYGLEASTVSRFMAINREYSIDGYSERLKPEYLDMGRSQLEEMLKLPHEDRKMIESAASREDIRELKRFNAQGPSEGPSELGRLVSDFWNNNQDDLKEVLKLDSEAPGYIDQVKDILNPSGSRTYKTGLFFLIFYTDKIAVKKFGGIPQEISWADFARDLPEPEETEEEQETILEETTETQEAEPEEPAREKPKEQPKENKKKEIAPAQKSLDLPRKTTDRPITIKNFAGTKYGGNGQSRKEYIDGLHEEEAAEYICKEYKAYRLQIQDFLDPKKLTKWLGARVDLRGKEVLDV